MRLAIALVALTVVGSAAAATRIPAYQWTPAQAAAQVVRWNPAIATDPDIPAYEVNVKSARCGGYGPARQGRYLSFRCTVVFQSSSVRGQPFARALWVKVRRQGSGQPCVSLTSLASIPFGCLRVVGARLPGSVGDAKLALVKRTGAVLPPTCTGYGAGYYLCSYQFGETKGRAAVSFAPSKVSVTLLG